MGLTIGPLNLVAKFKVDGGSKLEHVDILSLIDFTGIVDFIRDLNMLVKPSNANLEVRLKFKLTKGTNRINVSRAAEVYPTRTLVEYDTENLEAGTVRGVR